jgi:hypothetical protein
VAAYERLIEAQERIATSRTRAGATAAEIEGALEACEPPHPESLTDVELYIGTLARFVSALGGRLELSAAFGDESVAVPGAPT